MHKLLITICLLLLQYPSFSQNIGPNLCEERYKEFISAQVSSMMRFDQIEPISNDGAPVVKIPLFSVDDPDFDMSGILQYSSGGFKPWENDNFVGRDWTLITGGVIYREVKGMPDDFLPQAEAYALDGFLANVKSPLLNDATTKSRILNNPESNVSQPFFNDYQVYDTTFKLENIDADRETNSDIYNFRFGPHAGKFMINFDGTVNVLSYTGHKYEIDLSNYKNIVENRYDNYDSSITIKTDDGYAYTFGGNLGALEYTIWSWIKYPDFQNYWETEIVISAMHLTKVKSANNRILTYNYMNNMPKSFTQQRLNLLNPSQYSSIAGRKANLNCVLNLRAYHDDQSPYSPAVYRIGNKFLVSRNYDPRGTIGDCLRKSFTLNKLALLESIESDNNRIEFIYEERTVPYVNMNSLFGMSPFLSECGAAMRSVKIFNKNDSKWQYSKVHTLDYEYNGCRMFLKKIFNADDGAYTFKYDSLNINPYTGGVDYWGYLNQSEAWEPLRLIPAEVALDSQDQILVSNIREPKAYLCSANMLINMYLPTGGYKIYEYEPHTYSSSITQTRNNSFRKKLTPNSNGENKYAGGARVRKITYYAADGVKAKEVSYKYTQGIDLAQSSGILMHFPRYVHHENSGCFVSNGLVTPWPTPMIYANADGINISPAGNHVQYSRIIEIFQEETPLKNSVYKETVFSDYATNPDGLGVNKFYYTFSGSAASLDQMIVMSRDYDYFRWMRADMENMSHERGKILRETYYAGSAGIEKQIEYHYTRKNTDKYNVLISSPELYNTSFFVFYRPVKVPMSNYYLTGKEETEYLNGVSSVTSETYEIDEDGYLKSEVRATSKGDLHKTKYTYRKDRSKSLDFGGLLAEKSEWLISSEGEKMLTQQCFYYSSYGRASGVDTYSAGNVLVDNMHYVYTDGYGNPVLIARNGETQEIIIWGYNGSRPIAIIKNVEYDEVKRILGHYRILNNPRDYYKKISIQELEDLRVQLPGAHITTIEYNAERQPIVVTDPAGIKTCYQYSGRKLTKVYRTEGLKETVLEGYNYNSNVNNRK